MPGDDNAASRGTRSVRVGDSSETWKWIFITASAVFLLSAMMVWITGVSQLEEQIYIAIRDSISKFPIFRSITRLGSESILFPASVLLIVVLPREFLRRWWAWAAVMLVASALEGLGKATIGRPRPESLRPGFPSGHTAAAAAFYTMACYLTQHALKSQKAKRLAYGVAAILITLVALSRIALRVHWPLDVIGGAALGVAVLAGAAWWHDSNRAASPTLSVPGRWGSAIYRWQNVIGLALIVFLFLWAPMADDDSALDVMFDVSGLACIVGGLLVRLWAAGHSATVVNVTVTLPNRVVTTGPYRFMRHPLPLSLMLIASGLILLAESKPGLILLPALLILMFRVTIPIEESHLVQTCGREYTEYCRRVPVLPSLTPPVIADAASSLVHGHRTLWHSIRREVPTVAVTLLLAILAETDVIPRPFR
jgi:undecaprenyl-diphosphatase